MNKCKFTKAWIGKCNVETENEYCEEHSEMKCSVCGEQATHDCYETGFLVCGSPLCDSELCKIVHYIRQHNCKLDDYRNKLTVNEYNLVKIILLQDIQYRDLMVKYFDEVKKNKSL
jgi:hypothetical protein